MRHQDATAVSGSRNAGEVCDRRALQRRHRHTSIEMALWAQLGAAAYQYTMLNEALGHGCQLLQLQGTQPATHPGRLRSWDEAQPAAA